MGKKRKFDGSSTSGASIKKVEYVNLPTEQRKTWFLCDNLNVLDKYNKLLDWMCDWGSKEGFHFEGMKTLRCISGYPLIEVHLVYEGRSKKFLISRASLYILAFYCDRNGWRKFKDAELDIDFGSERAREMERSAKYEGQPWETLGLKAMVDAFNYMDAKMDLVASKWCEIFAVHFSEACRIKLVRSKIARSMIPFVSARWDLDDNEKILVGNESCIDVINSLKPIIVDLNTTTVDGGIQIREFIKKFKQLSKAWILYSLSQKKIFQLKESIADDCGIRYRRSLRYALGLLSNTNLKKITEEWMSNLEKGRCPPNFGQSDLIFMQSKVSELESLKK